MRTETGNTTTFHARRPSARMAVATLVSTIALTLAACSPSADTEEGPVAQAPVNRCVTVDKAMEAGPVPGTWTQAVTATDLQTVSSAGFDTVRLTVPLADYTTPDAPFDLDKQALDRLETVVDWALGARLNVIIAVSDFDALETDTSGQSGRLNRLWLQVAKRLKPVDGTVIFELVDAPGEGLTGKAMDDLNRVILEQLRGVDPARWVILPSGAGNSLDALSRAQPPRASRTILSLHYAEPVAFTSPEPEMATDAEWGTTDEFRAVISDLDTALTIRDRTRLPVMIGHFGVDETVSDVMRARWTRAVRRAAEDRGIGWCYAAFGGEDGLFDLESGEWVPELVTALFRNGDRLN